MDREQNRQKVICAENIMKQNKQNKYGPKTLKLKKLLKYLNIWL